ncbi:SRPBCC family protein [Streptomyces sp. NPDC127038]|uniref:SRPBCC family protein n=1 Tax=Streptomyces sp. NPDC127038 TaxID=3347114 RepID=UPI00364F6E27
MASQRKHSARLTAPVAAPAGVVYGLLADAPRWPVLLPSYIHVERVDSSRDGDSLRLWQLRPGPGRHSQGRHGQGSESGQGSQGGQGQVRSVFARRVLRPRERRIDFDLRDPLLPDAPAHGSWNVSPESSGRCLVTLCQEQPAAPGQTRETLQEQVRGELAAVAEAAERWDCLDELLLAFEDSLYVQGSPEIVYDFLYRIADWADLVPHVEYAEVTEDRPGVQNTLLHTSDPDTGDTTVTRAVRLCFPAAGRIVHRATLAPDPLAAHYGEWSLEPDAQGVRVTHTHQVLLRESAVHDVLGPGALPVDARRHVRERLGRASTETLTLARWHAESALRRLR